MSGSPPDSPCRDAAQDDEAGERQHRIPASSAFAKYAATPAVKNGRTNSHVAVVRMRESVRAAGNASGSAQADASMPPPR